MGDFAEALRKAGLEAADAGWEGEVWPGAAAYMPSQPSARSSDFGPEIPDDTAARVPEEVLNDEELREEEIREEEEGARTEIPRSKHGFWRARSVLIDHSPDAERFRLFAVRVRQELETKGTGSVLITSALRSEGKTITASNLALALASIAAGRRIALLDLDLRSPSVFRAMGTLPRVGIEHVLSRQASLSSVCIRTDVPAFDFFPVADAVPNAHELLASPLLGSLLREIESRYDTVVCDTPPVLPVPDVSLILPHVGACVLVARGGTSHQSTFRDMLGLLPRRKLIGCFLNQELSRRHADRYRYSSDRKKGPDARRAE